MSLSPVLHWLSRVKNMADEAMALAEESVRAYNRVLKNTFVFVFNLSFLYCSGVSLSEGLYHNKTFKV